MVDIDLELTGIPENDADRLISAILHGEKIAEKAATNIMIMAKKGQDEREILLERGAIVNLMQMCTADNPATSIAKGALAIAAIASNFSECLEESRVYVFEDAQVEAMQQGIVPLLTTTLTSWQPDAQAAAANALADICIQNFDVRKQMLAAEAARALVNLLHSENQDVHCAALAALRAYAVEAKYAEEVVSRGCLPQACKLALNDGGGDKGSSLAKQESTRIVARAFALIWMLAVADPVKLKVARERDGQVARQVVRSLQSKSAAVAYWAVALLRQLCMLPDLRADLAAQGVHQHLIHLLKSEEDQVAINAIGCLAALAHKAEVKQVINGDIGDALHDIVAPAKGVRRQSKALQQRAAQLRDLLDNPEGGPPFPRSIAAFRITHRLERATLLRASEHIFNTCIFNI